PFGAGAGALSWAILAAAAKRPVTAFWGPLGAGVGLTCLLAADPERALPLLCVANLTVAWLSILLGAWGQSGHLRREPLVRPMPLRPWQVVLADVLPRVLLACMFSGACGLTLLLLPLPGRFPVALALLAGVPAAQL